MVHDFRARRTLACIELNEQSSGFQMRCRWDVGVTDCSESFSHHLLEVRTFRWGIGLASLFARIGFVRRLRLAFLRRFVALRRRRFLLHRWTKFAFSCRRTRRFRIARCLLGRRHDRLAERERDLEWYVRVYVCVFVCYVSLKGLKWFDRRTNSVRILLFPEEWNHFLSANITEPNNRPLARIDMASMYRPLWTGIFRPRSTQLRWKNGRCIC